jgi:lipopolysaccharide/colanic/teichoic acid biosynthesis glycosyltransferase
MQNKTTENIEEHDVSRIDLADELYEKYVKGTTFTGSLKQKIRFFRKKYTWIIIVGGAKFLKRAIDVCAAVVLILMLAPLFAFVAISIKLTDGGPVMFFQKRVGLWGREMNFPKFRSMVMNAEELKLKLMEQNQHDNNKTFKIKNDPRITWIGRFIRKLSIDELPQLWCVLIGDMSLVGPRPPTVNEVADYTLEDRRRLDVVPGLTCIWQVSGRSDIPFDQQVKLDVDYINSQSLWFDFVILLKTIPAVLFGKGAY